MTSASRFLTRGRDRVQNLLLVRAEADGAILVLAGCGEPAGTRFGGAVARAFAADGASLFLTGRTLAPVEAVAKDIAAAGGSAAAAEAG